MNGDFDPDAYLKSKGVKIDSTTTASPAEPPKEESMSFSDMLSHALSNIPSSAEQFGSGITGMFIHPVDTFKNIGKIIAATENPQMQPEVFGPIKDFYAKRYGGLEELKKTIASDPVGFIADLSTVLSGAGAAVKGVGTLGKFSSLMKAGEVISDVGKAVDPLTAVTTVGKAIIPGTQAGKLMERALKQSTELSPEQRATNVETALREGLIPTRKSLDKSREIISGLGKEIDEKIVDLSKQNVMVDTHSVVERLNDAEKFFGETALPKEYMAELARIKDEFLKTHGDYIPIEKAQQIKKNTNALLRKAYGELKTVRREGEKGLVRGVKEGIEEANPQIKELNKRMGELYELNPSIEKAINRIDNTSRFNLGTGYYGGIVGLATRNPALGVGAALIKHIMDQPEVKATIAIGLRRAKEAGITGGTATQAVRGVTKATVLTRSQREQDSSPQVKSALEKIERKIQAGLPLSTAEKNILYQDTQK